jgi:hypothetical protein
VTPTSWGCPAPHASPGAAPVVSATTQPKETTMKSFRRVRRARFTAAWGRFYSTRDNSTGKPLTLAYLAGQSSYVR